MDSNTLHLTLPEPLREFVQTEAAQGAFKSPEEYVTALLSAERKRRLAEQLEGMAAEALASGVPVEPSDQFWDERRRRIIERFGTGEAS